MGNQDRIKTKVKEPVDFTSTTISIPIAFPDDKKEVVFKAKTPTRFDHPIYLPAEVSVVNEDKEYVETIKELYQKSLKSYGSVRYNLSFISNSDFIGVLEEIQLVTLNILLVFAENPHKILNHRRFIEYYQERIARFVEQYIKLTYHVQNPDTSTIETIEKIINNLKGVCYIEYKRISEMDMSDLTAELRVMEQNLAEYDNALNNALSEKSPTLKTNISSEHIDLENKKKKPVNGVEGAIINIIEMLKGIIVGGVAFSIVLLILVFGIIIYKILN